MEVRPEPVNDGETPRPGCANSLSRGRDGRPNPVAAMTMKTRKGKRDWTVDNNAEGAFEDALDEFLSREEVLDGWKAHRRALDADDVDAQGLYRLIAADRGETLPQTTLDALKQLDYDSWSVPNPETLAWARELKAAGFRIGILTNMPTGFIPWFDRCAHDFRALADAEVISGVERITKPKPEIYALMAQRMGLPPASLFFLDDTQANVDAARACGWHAERFVSVAQAKAALDALP